jgi:acetyl-CoA acetyltransferase
MDLYMKTYGVKHEAFAPFAINAHTNACAAGHALFKKTLTVEQYEASKTISPPVQV